GPEDRRARREERAHRGEDLDRAHRGAATSSRPRSLRPPRVLRSGPEIAPDRGIVSLTAKGSGEGVCLSDPRGTLLPGLFSPTGVARAALSPFRQEIRSHKEVRLCSENSSSDICPDTDGCCSACWCSSSRARSPCSTFPR